MTHLRHLFKLLTLLTLLLPLLLIANAQPIAVASTPPLSSGGENLEFVAQIGGPSYAVAVEGDYAYVGVGPRLVILDISDSANSTVVGQTEVLPGIVRGVAIAGSYAYVANDDEGGLRVINIANPESPTEVGSFDTPGAAEGVAIADSYAYVADGYNGDLRVINIANPESPTEVGFFDTQGNAFDVAIAGSYAYVADDDEGLRVINIANPQSPTEVGYYQTPGYARNIAIAGSYAYVADGNSGLRVINIANPQSPTQVASYDTLSSASSVAIAGSYAYVADGTFGLQGLQVIDMANPQAPTEVGSVDRLGVVQNLAIAGNYAYVPDGNGLRVINIANPQSPTEVGSYDTPGYAQDVAIAGSYAYVTDDGSGLRVISIANPQAPTEVGSFDTPSSANSVAIAGSYAYVAIHDSFAYVADGSDESNGSDSGLLVINIANPQSPTQVGFFDTPDIVYDVAIAGSYAYLADGSRGLRVINIANPQSPTEVGFFDTPGSAHNVAIAGSYAYVADDYRGLRVINIANPQRPTEVGSYDTAGRALDVAIAGSYAYVADWDGGLVILRLTGELGPTPTPTAPPTITPLPTNTPLPTATHTSTNTPIATATERPIATQINATPTVSPGSGDAYEPNNSCTQAQPISIDGSVQEHTFHQQADRDWVRFEMTEGTTYLIEARVPEASKADVILQVYDECAGQATPHDSFAPTVRLQFDAPRDGTLYMQLSNYDPQAAGADVSYDLSVRRLSDEPVPGAVILVAGRLRANDRLQSNIHQVTNQVYKTFSGHGYTADRIHYLAHDLSLNPDNNPGTQDVDGFANRKRLEYAITQWATNETLDLGPDRALTLYMMDHGDYDKLYLNTSADQVSPEEIDEWLEILEAARPGVKINVIIEACLSGSFIDPSKSLSKPGRVVITSSSNATNAYASREGGAHFSNTFVQALDQEMSLYSAFAEAKEVANSWHPDQTAWLDDNGDGFYTADDGLIAQRRGFAYAGSLIGKGEPPYISSVNGPATIENRRGQIEATVRDDVAGANLNVWAVIYEPSYTPPSPGEELVLEDEETLPSVRLSDSDNDGIYKGTFTGFDQTGAYRIVVYAVDEDGQQSRPRATVVQTGWALYLPLVLR